MNICVTVNSKYMRYLYVMLQSLYENNQEGSIDLYVLQRDFTDDDKKIISEITDQYHNRVFYVLVDKKKLDDMPKYIGGRDDLPSEIICFRLLLPELLPDTLDRVLLLDVDVVVNADISELYHLDFENNVFAAAPNMCHNFDIIEEWRRWYPANCTNWTHYNIGVLMWNLEKIRNSYPHRYILKCACENRIKIETFDEELFNVVFGQDLIKEISAEEWNYIITQTDVFKTPKFKIYSSIEELKSRCVIVHYAAMNPWQEGAAGEKFRLWWEYAKKTPFYHEFITEQLSRDEAYIAKLENALHAEKVVISNCNAIYELKGSGKAEKYFSDKCKNYYFYGAGMMAEKIYDLLVFEGKEDVVKGVFDKKKKGKFHDIPIYEEIDKMVYHQNEDIVIIITPSLGRKEILEDVKKHVKGKAEVILLQTFLENILKTGDGF